jgi:integrase
VDAPDNPANHKTNPPLLYVPLQQTVAPKLLGWRLSVFVEERTARLQGGSSLQWKFLDLDSRKLRVVHSLYKRQLVAPKSASSVRTIALGEALTSALIAHRMSSIFTGSGDFVFCKQDGTSLNPDVLRKDILYPVLDRLNIPRPKGASGFHAFRHSAASLINAETGNLKITQKFLGHANVSTTADIYTHTSEAMEREAAAALERSIFGSCSRSVHDLEPRTRIQ